MLRQYQESGVKMLRNELKNGKKRLVMVAPTGAGKTVIFSFMAKSAVDRDYKVLIVSDRSELLGQTDGTLAKFDMQAIEITAASKLKSLERPLYIGMVETLHRRLVGKHTSALYTKFLGNLNLIIFDECHKQAFNKIFPFIRNDTTVIGATATPHRSGNMTSLDEFYEGMVEICKVKELIETGYLCNPNYFGLPLDVSKVKLIGGDYDPGEIGELLTEHKVFDGVFQNYIKHTPGKKALIFSSSINSSVKLIEELTARGLPCKHLDSNMTAECRKSILSWFKRTKGALLSNVGILNTGFDQPDVEVIILYRATKSLPLFLQMVGRGSRTCDSIGKKEFFVLDFGNNVKTHGFWHEDREWSLIKKEKLQGVAPIKECPSCAALLATSVKICPYCEHEFLTIITEDVKEGISVELERLNYRKMTMKAIKAKATEWTAVELLDIQKERALRTDWAFDNLLTIKQSQEYAAERGYTDKWVKKWCEIKKIFI